MLTEFFLFPTMTETGRENGPRMGFDVGAINRIQILLGLWGDLDASWRRLGGNPSGGRYGLFSDEFVFDETTGRIYSARIRVDSDNALSVPALDPVSGRQQLPGGHRALGICDYLFAKGGEAVTVDRRTACRERQPLA